MGVFLNHYLPENGTKTNPELNLTYGKEDVKKNMLFWDAVAGIMLRFLNPKSTRMIIRRGAIDRFPIEGTESVDGLLKGQSQSDVVGPGIAWIPGDVHDFVIRNFGMGFSIHC